MKSTNLLIFPVALLVSILSFFYLVKPEWDKYSSNKQELTNEQEKLDLVKNNKAKFDKISSDYSNLEKDQKKLISNAIPIGLLQEDFLYILGDIASETGVQLTGTSFSKNSSDKAEGEIIQNNVSLEMNGNFFQIKKAVYLIENTNRLVKIKSISLSKGEENNDIKANIQLNIFNKENDFKKVAVDINSPYFKKMLTQGLNIDLLNRYQGYREKTDYFDFSWKGKIGKENIFVDESSLVNKTEKKEDTPVEIVEVDSSDEGDDTEENLEADLDLETVDEDN